MVFKCIIFGLVAFLALQGLTEARSVRDVNEAAKTVEKLQEVTNKAIDNTIRDIDNLFEKSKNGAHILNLLGDYQINITVRDISLKMDQLVENAGHDVSHCLVGFKEQIDTIAREESEVHVSSCIYTNIQDTARALVDAKVIAIASHDTVEDLNQRFLACASVQESADCYDKIVIEGNVLIASLPKKITQLVTDSYKTAFEIRDVSSACIVGHFSEMKVKTTAVVDKVKKCIEN